MLLAFLKKICGGQTPTHWEIHGCKSQLNFRNDKIYVVKTPVMLQGQSPMGQKKLLCGEITLKNMLQKGNFPSNLGNSKGV